MSHSTKLEPLLETAFADVDGFLDLVPESPNETFTIPAEETPSPFVSEQTVRFMTHGIDITLTFEQHNDAFVPDDAASLSRLEEARREAREETEAEASNTESKDGWLSSILAGLSPDHSGEHDVVHEDPMVLNPFSRDWSYGSFTGCHEDELGLLSSVTVDEERLVAAYRWTSSVAADDGEQLSGVTVLSELGILDEVLGVIVWLETLLSDLCIWNSCAVCEIGARTFTDATVAAVKLNLPEEGNRRSAGRYLTEDVLNFDTVFPLSTRNPSLCVRFCLNPLAGARLRCNPTSPALDIDLFKDLRGTIQTIR